MTPQGGIGAYCTLPRSSNAVASHVTNTRAWEEGQIGELTRQMTKRIVDHETTMKHMLHSGHLLKRHIEIGIYFTYLFYSFSTNNSSLGTAKAAFF